MDQNITAIERAFQIAGSGNANTTYEIRKLLKAEGYSDQAIGFPSLLKQLRHLMKHCECTSTEITAP